MAWQINCYLNFSTHMLCFRWDSVQDMSIMMIDVYALTLYIFLPALELTGSIIISSKAESDISRLAMICRISLVSFRPLLLAIGNGGAFVQESYGETLSSM